METMKILFLCTGNSCRSQMAEGWARHLKGDVLEPFSAGTVARGMDPRAVRAMAEVGVDISGHRSKTLAAFTGVEFDAVITVCGHAAETCPVFPGRTRRFHAGFEDPPALARAAATEEEAMVHYRRVRDEIRNFVKDLPEALGEP
jgi:arsenate reductase